MSFSEQHLRETAEIVSKLDPALCEKAVELLVGVRARGGRLFVLGSRRQRGERFPCGK